MNDNTLISIYSRIIPNVFIHPSAFIMAYCYSEILKCTTRPYFYLGRRQSRTIQHIGRNTYILIAETFILYEFVSTFSEILAVYETATLIVGIYDFQNSND